MTLPRRHPPRHAGGDAQPARRARRGAGRARAPGLQIWLDPSGASEAWLASAGDLVIGAGALWCFGPVEVTYLVALALALGTRDRRLARPGEVPASPPQRPRPSPPCPLRPPRRGCCCGWTRWPVGADLDTVRPGRGVDGKRGARRGGPARAAARVRSRRPCSAPRRSSRSPFSVCPSSPARARSRSPARTGVRMVPFLSIGGRFPLSNDCAGDILDAARTAGRPAASSSTRESSSGHLPPDHRPGRLLASPTAAGHALRRRVPHLHRGLGLDHGVIDRTGIDVLALTTVFAACGCTAPRAARHPGPGADNRAAQRIPGTGARLPVTCAPPRWCSTAASLRSAGYIGPRDQNGVWSVPLVCG